MNKITLDKPYLKKWVNNLLVFLTVPISMYLLSVVGVVSQTGHVFNFPDLVPNDFVRGGVVLWILNTALDYLRKLRAQ